MQNGTRLSGRLRREIIRRVRKTVRVRRIVLFGSAARGRMTPDSDVDLLVLTDRPIHPRRAGVRLTGALRGLGRPFDFVVMTATRYEESRPVPGALAHDISRHGRVLYAAP